ncbi:hypothetical protein [Butyrivibrio sp.]|uniref:hypothetical protein n=1 Tax=Butyrivibrio sp. TaxID=28121 RepID=UPI0025BE4C20|nr:hypothetical protein [Butyrivibrio sp.]MBQ7430210.1 hypothetical protein [Butyrivibrio sp.]MBQ9303385.1 hypothetical protein [Butyrivibrio sp.]
MVSLQAYKDKKLNKVESELNKIDDLRARELREQMKNHPDSDIYKELHKELSQLDISTTTGSAYTIDSF